MESLFMLVVLAVPIAAITGIVLSVKKQKKTALISFAVAIISLVLMVITVPDQANLSVKKDTIETNDRGLAIVKGATNSQAELSIDGQVIPNEKGHFSHEVELTDDTSKKIVITTQYKKEKLSKTVTVKASKAFIKYLAKEEQRLVAEKQAKKIELEEAEARTALELAEATPTKENYDKAFTLINALSNKNKELSDRLAHVHKAIQLAAEKTEKTTVAEAALGTAETQPTKENYETAKLAIAAIPGGAPQLTKRLETVNNSIVAAEQEAARQKEIAQATANAEAAPTGNQIEAPNTQIVLITPTGKKYHNRVCGNGNYSEATLEQAQAKGLDPCSKCF